MTATAPTARRPRWLALRMSARVRELAGQGARFAAVGGGATLLQLAVYAFVADGLGAQVANVLSWSIATVVAGFAHHRFTFRLGSAGDERDHLVNLVSSLAALLLSSAVLALAGNPAGAVGTVLLLAVNGAVGTGRFALLRWWLTVRRPRTRPVAPPERAPVETSSTPLTCDDGLVLGNNGSARYCYPPVATARRPPEACQSGRMGHTANVLCSSRAPRVQIPPLPRSTVRRRSARTPRADGKVNRRP